MTEMGATPTSPHQERRDGAAAKRFFRRLLRGLQHKPKRLITDGLYSYAVAQRAILSGVRHGTSRYLNNRVSAQHYLRSLSTASSSPDSGWLSAGAGKGVPDLATGDLRPTGRVSLAPVRTSSGIRPVQVTLAMPTL
jgi:DDE domain